MAAVLLLIADQDGAVGTGATRYRTVGSGHSSATIASTEANVQRTERSGGTCSLMQVRVPGNISNNTFVINFRKNTANGNQTLTFAAGETGLKQDVTNTDSVAIGDILSVKHLNNGTGLITCLGTGVLFNASTNTVNHYQLNGGTSTTTSFGTTTYFGLSDNPANATLANVEVKSGTAGTLKNLGVRLSANTITALATAVYTSQINGVNGNITISFASGETGLKEDTANTDVIALNDLIALKLVVGGVSGSVVQQIIWLSNETTNNKTDYVARVHASTVAQQNRFSPITGQYKIVTESVTQYFSSVKCILSNLRTYISANTWTSNTTFITRKNTANGNQSAVVATTVTGWVHDSVNIDTISSETDLINSQYTTSAGSGSITIETIVVTSDSTVTGGSTLLMMGCG